MYKYEMPLKGIKVSLEFWTEFSKNFYTNKEGQAFVEHSTIGTATIYSVRKEK